MPCAGNPVTPLAIRYIGFRGLLFVSFCEMAGMTTPFTLAVWTLLGRRL